MPATTAIPGVFPIVKRYEHPLNTRCSFSKLKCDCIKSLKLGEKLFIFPIDLFHQALAFDRAVFLTEPGFYLSLSASGITHVFFGIDVQLFHMCSCTAFFNAESDNDRCLLAISNQVP